MDTTIGRRAGLVQLRFRRNHFPCPRFLLSQVPNPPPPAAAAVWVSVGGCVSLLLVESDQSCSFSCRFTLSGWSSGTGGAGVLGSLAYLALTEWVGLSSKNALLVVSPLPIFISIRYRGPSLHTMPEATSSVHLYPCLLPQVSSSPSLGITVRVTRSTSKWMVRMKVSHEKMASPLSGMSPRCNRPSSLFQQISLS